MRGYTRKRGRTWTALWDVTDLETGKRHQQSKAGFRTQRDAQRHLAEVVPQVQDGTYTEPSKQPLARFLVDEWLPAFAPTVRPTTVNAYTSEIRTHVVGDELGALPLRSLSPAHFTKRYARLTEAGASAATVRLLHKALRRALSDAVRWGKIARNPASGAAVPRDTETRVTAWTGSELAKFLDHVQGDPWAPLWRLAATTGMRRGELLGLS